jgi:cytochrome c oxidase subunit 2
MNLSDLNKATRNSGVINLVIGALVLLAGGFIISAFGSAVLPTAASAQAERTDALFHFMLVIAGAIFLLVQGLLAYSVIRFRRKPGDDTDGAPLHGNATLEFIWTAIPSVIVLAITIYAYAVWVANTAPQANEQRIGVVGQRYAWAFSYVVPVEDIPASIDLDTMKPDVRAAIEAEGNVTINAPQMYSWVNQPVLASMETQDVIHSLWIPAMRIKQDLLPGRTTEVRFTPTQPGTYRIVCTELCGTGHGNMAGEVRQTVAIDGTPIDTINGAWLIIYENEDQYIQEFLEPELRRVLFPPEDPVERGRQILASGQYPCATCHILDDLGWQGNIGPALNGIGGRTNRLAATGDMDMDAYLHTSIRMPASYLVPGFGNLMPQFNPAPDQPNYMPDEDLDAIVAYLLSQTE